MNEVEIVVTSKDRAGPGFDGAERRANGFRAVMEKIGNTVSTLFTKGVGAAVETGAELFQGFFKRTSEAAVGMATSVGTAIAGSVTAGGGMTAATGGINLLVGALLAAASAAGVAATGFVALAPIVLALGGLVGAATTALVGFAGSAAVLKMGLSGLGDAFGEVMENGKATDETLKKLSPNARKLVREFERIAPALSGLRKFVQDRLLEGMNREFRDLASKWLPAVEPMLGNIAGSFNNLGKSIFRALGDTTFIRNMQTAAAGFGDMIDRIALGIDDFIGGFGRLAAASTPVLEEIGDLIGRIMEKFGAWMESAEKSGALDQFMQRAAATLRDIWDIGGLVVGIGKEIIDIFFPQSQKTSESFLGGVKQFLQDIKDWLSDPENQEKVQEWVDKIQEFVDKVATEWIPKAIEWANKIDGWVKKVEEWADKIEKFVDDVSDAWDELKAKTEAAFNAIIGIFLAVPLQVAAALGALPGVVAGLFNQARTAAVTATTGLVTAAISSLASLPGRARSAIAGLVGAVSSVFGSARAAAVSAVSSMLSQVASLLASIPGRARSAVGNLGGVLTGAGRSLVQGLINGINSQLGALRSALGRITSLIPDWKGPLDKDRRLLTPAGQAIMDGLIAGIDSRVQALQAKLAGVTSGIAAWGAQAADAADSPMVAAARELLARVKSGGKFYEDFSFSGSSANLSANNDALADIIYGRYLPKGFDFGPAGSAQAVQKALERFIADETPAAVVAPAAGGFGAPSGGLGAAVGAGGGVTINLYVQGSIRSDRDLIALIRDELLSGGLRGLVTT